MQPLVAFYEETARDVEGRSLSEILAWDDDTLEEVHDYIQWLFPLREPSRFNPNAPLLDDAQAAVFRSSPALRQRVRQAFERMLAFYGLRLEGDHVVHGPNWDQRRREWVSPLDHNFLRITRILTSLQLLGLGTESRAFQAALEKIARDYPADVGNSVYYWREATQPNPP